MIKKLFLVLFMLVTIAIQPAHSGPIIIIWPSSMDKAKISPQEILGTWVAWYDKQSWIVSLEQDQKSGLVEVSMQDTASQSHHSIGQLRPNGNTLFGKIATDHGHTHSMLLFRDRQGTKLRIIIDRFTYYDLVLSNSRIN